MILLYFYTRGYFDKYTPVPISQTNQQVNGECVRGQYIHRRGLNVGSQNEQPAALTTELYSTFNNMYVLYKCSKENSKRKKSYDGRLINTTLSECKNKRIQCVGYSPAQYSLVSTQIVSDQTRKYRMSGMAMVPMRISSFLSASSSSRRSESCRIWISGPYLPFAWIQIDYRHTLCRHIRKIKLESDFYEQDICCRTLCWRKNMWSKR